MKEKAFSLTRDDFKWEYFAAGGKGGQKQNKTASACRVSHKPSGAVAESREGREQLDNRRLAFKKICADPKLLSWIEIKVAKMAGVKTPEEVVEQTLVPENLRIEVKNERGKWEVTCDL